MGECPEWYLPLRAARYLGVPPWDLADQAAVWFYRALTAEWAENRAAEDAEKHR